jgi:hypothetical protein
MLRLCAEHFLPPTLIVCTSYDMFLLIDTVPSLINNGGENLPSMLSTPKEILRTS